MDRKLPFYYPYYTILPIYLDLRESVKFALLSVNQDALVTSSPLYGLSFRIVEKAFSTISDVLLYPYYHTMLPIYQDLRDLL